ncbi:GIY-YIG nuclease family protein [Actinotalea sp. JY-7876]|uniref:GIY-YIG nuclease family protein n=1 Tax=Actinotalea sp. JY-7876 TaxID=2758442 RepID=UPI0015F4C09D|nr:GIY-YIG nuclease family protein [Actinotalea sp. JY-7876]
MSFVADFRLSVTAALRDQLIAVLDSLEATDLSEANIGQLERRGGVYQLFEDGVLVYVGKSTRDLPARLTQHRTKIDGRIGQLIDRVTFRCVYVDEDLDAVAPETLLISRYRGSGLAVWNTNGFGNKDPGQNRDRSLVKVAHFDRVHPIDLDKQIVVTRPTEPVTLGHAMSALKTALPYNFRFGSDALSNRELASIDVTDDFTSGSMRTAREWLTWLMDRLPDGWTIIALPGYVIAYSGQDPSTIQSRTGAWMRVDGVTVFEEHEAVFAAGPVGAGE